MTKIKIFQESYAEDLEKKINQAMKGCRILSTSICTKSTEGITRTSRSYTYYVAIVVYEEE